MARSSYIIIRYKKNDDFALRYFFFFFSESSCQKSLFLYQNSEHLYNLKYTTYIFYERP